MNHNTISWHIFTFFVSSLQKSVITSFWNGIYHLASPFGLRPGAATPPPRYAAEHLISVGSIIDLCLKPANFINLL